MKPHKFPHKYKTKIINRDDVIKIPGDIPEVLYLGRLFAHLNSTYTKIYEQMATAVDISDAINYMNKIDEKMVDIVTTIGDLYEKTNYYSSNYFYEPRVKDIKLIIVPKRLKGLRVVEDIYKLTSLFKGHSDDATINVYLSKLAEYSIKINDLIQEGYNLLKVGKAYYPNKLIFILQSKKEENALCGIV